MYVNWSPRSDEEIKWSRINISDNDQELYTVGGEKPTNCNSNKCYKP
jgi:hypothetical protein